LEPDLSGGSSDWNAATGARAKATHTDDAATEGPAACPEATAQTKYGEQKCQPALSGSGVRLQY
jgi:hypothetical protein